MSNKKILNGFTLLIFGSIFFALGWVGTVNAQVVSEVRTSNHSPSSVTITWETDVEAEGLLRYRAAGTSGPFVTLQENRSLIRLHQVRLQGGLSANTTYEFEVESGGTVSATSTFRTTTSATFAPPGVVVADIFRVGGGLPVGAEGAMLFVTVKRFDDARRSFPLSAFTDKNGSALITLNLYDDANGAFFPVPRIGDSLFVDVRSGLLGSIKFTTTIATNPASAPIYLGSLVLAPEVLPGELTTLEDNPGSGTLIALDTASNALTFSIVSQGTKGVAAITNAATGAYTYTPLPDVNGVDNFTFKANDGLQDSNIGSMSITIEAVNDAPTLADISDPAAIDEDAAEQAVNLSGITAGEGETQALTVTASSSNTALIANPVVTYISPNTTGSLTYTPVFNAHGT
ncbi:MAG: Ig-like domain-containing protein, partial [Candidatus Latescibacteria bacterium]|nr:Ig-like domain-containing protein [Candidatus Latescibacterota bacterium]